MAGNTSRGVGVGESASSRDRDDDDDRPRLIDEDDTRGLHSGPTVVDDQKVAEVLRKLRSLDAPPGPLTGVTNVVVDGSSSEPTRLDSGDIVLDGGPSVEIDTGQIKTGPAVIDPALHALMRPTAIGRSPSTPVAEQPVTIPPDLARGTLFGRSIHLPDVNTPEEAEIELSSGPIDFLDGAPSSQPFPLADRPAVVVPPPTSTPARRFRTPYDADLHTHVIDPPRSKGFKRAVAFIGGLGIAGLGLFAWWHYGGGADGASPAAAAAPTAPAPAAPTVSPMPPTPAPPKTEPAAAAATAPKAPEPPAKPAAPAEATAPTPEAAPAPTPVVAATEARHASGPSRSHARRERAERRSTAKAAAPAAERAPEAAAKPEAPKRKLVDEDPDATMAPSQ